MSPKRTRWTVEQVLALAPDASSAKAARGLATPRTWSQLGSNQTLVWGKCQGSGRQPYQVTVDLNEPAFRCTCPSRKFPCKHGVALLLLWAKGDGSVADVESAAEFAAEWASERAIRARTREARRQSRAEAPVDIEAQGRRQAERESLMTAGLEDFERWLFDVLRQGFASARRQPFAFWDTAAARLVDAQMPALAERVRTAASEIHRRPDWADFLLAETGKWYTAIRAWRRRDRLPADAAADLRTFLGWSRRSEEVLEGERVSDRWHVIGLREDGDERLRSQRTWLWGEATEQLVVVLDFAAAGATLAVAHVLGTVVEGELVLYPGSAPRRARFTGEQRVVGRTGTLRAATPTVEEALDRAAMYVAANPWIERVPMALGTVIATATGTAANGHRAAVVDQRGETLPLAEDERVWPLLALSGGRRIDVFGEWADDRLQLCSLVCDERLVAL